MDLYDHQARPLAEHKPQNLSQ